MAVRSLSFLLFGEDVTASRAFDKVAASAGKADATIRGSFSKGSLVGIGAVVAGLGFAAKGAADFQTQMLRLVTAAGESQKNLGLVSKGVLDISAATGTSAGDLASAMYIIESAGFHGAAGLKVLAATSEGAKIEMGNVGDVSKAVAALLVDYHLPAQQAADVTSKLITAVGRGMTTFQDLAEALPHVAARAQSAHVSLAEMAAAMATITQHGTPASVAATYLGQTIGQMEAPSAKARKAMQALGIDANQLGLTLSSGSGHGLADAIGMVDRAITTHLTPSGLVALDMFKKSKTPVTDYQKLLANIPPTLVTTFGALAAMTGGVKSLQGFLQLGGGNLKNFQAATVAVGAATAEAGGHVEGWALKQTTLNQKLDELKQAANKAKIELGDQLIPALTNVANFVLAHKHEVELFAGAIVGIKIAIGGAKLAQEGWAASQAFGSLVKQFLAIGTAAGTMAAEVVTADKIAAGGAGGAGAGVGAAGGAGVGGAAVKGGLAGAAARSAAIVTSGAAVWPIAVVATIINSSSSQLQMYLTQMDSLQKQYPNVKHLGVDAFGALGKAMAAGRITVDEYKASLVTGTIDTANNLAATRHLADAQESARIKTMNLATAHGQLIATLNRTPASVKTLMILDKAQAEINLANVKAELLALSRMRTISHVQVVGDNVYGVRTLLQGIYGQPIYQNIIATPGGGVIVQPGAAHPAAHASGGYLDVGWNLVGEQGPEMVYNASGSNNSVKSASATRQTGHTVTYNITVHAGMGTDGYAVGRQIKSAMEAFAGHPVTF